MLRTAQRNAVVVAALALVLAACAGGGTPGADVPAGADAATGTEVTPAYDGTVITELPSNATGASLGKGFVTSADIAAADGGTVTSYDRRLSVTLAAGALSADATVTVTTITNSAPGGLGPAYLLDIGGVSFTAATITGTFGAMDLEGTAPEAIELASQGADGTWTVAGGATVTPKTDPSGNPIGGTVSAQVTHFSPWAMLAGWQLQPLVADVSTGEKLQLFLMNCEANADPAANPDTLMPQCRQEDHDYLAITMTPAVNGKQGGDSSVGTVTVDPASGTMPNSITYTAPAAVPSPATVDVSDTLTFPYLKNVGILVSHVTVQGQPHGKIRINSFNASYSATDDRGQGDLQYDNGQFSMYLGLYFQLTGPSYVDRATWGLDKSANLVVKGFLYTQDDLTYSDPNGGVIRSTLACQPQTLSLPWSDHDVQMNSGVTLTYRPGSKDFLLHFFGGPLRNCHESLVNFPDDPDSREADHDDDNGSWLGPDLSVILPAGADPDRLSGTFQLALNLGEGIPAAPVGVRVEVDIDLQGTFANAQQ